MKRGKADYTEIRIEDKETSRVVLRGSPPLTGLAPCAAAWGNDVLTSAVNPRD